MLARIIATKEGITEFGFVPCYINKQGAPEILKTYEEAKEVIDYVQQISEEQKLSIHLQWNDEGWVKVTGEES